MPGDGSARWNCPVGPGHRPALDYLDSPMRASAELLVWGRKYLPSASRPYSTVLTPVRVFLWAKDRVAACLVAPRRACHGVIGKPEGTEPQYGLVSMLIRLSIDD